MYTMMVGYQTILILSVLVVVYTKKVTPVNLNEQLANNPEVTVSSRNAAITRLGQRLQENNKHLAHKVETELAQSDQPYWTSQVQDPYILPDIPQELGSGSGPSYQDDEDYTDESGSGSGNFPYKPQNPKGNQDFYEVTTKSKGASQQGKVGESSSKDNNGAVSVHRTVLALIPLIVAILFNG